MTTSLAAASPEADDEDRLGQALRRLAAGDARALEPIYDACAADIHGLALWRTGSAEDAADVVHDVFLKLARSGARLLDVRRPRTYVLTLAHRAAVDLLRRRRPREPVDNDLLVVDADPSIGADVHNVSRALRHLPAAQREAVYLRHYRELSFAEIGRVTGAATFTAASRYRLGIGRLRRLLGVKS